MKKIVAFICALTMLFSFTTTSFANEWDFLVQQYNSYDATSEFSIVLNKPLECLSLLNGEAGFDIKYMIEELTKAKYTARIQAEMSEDALKAKMAMAINADVPVNLSEDLKFGADVTLYMWVDYDFTSVDNAKYNIIVKNPLNGQYLTLDYFEVMADSYGVDMKSELLEMYNGMNLKAGIEEITALMKHVYEKNATLDAKGNEYTITFTNNGIIDFAFDFMTEYFNTEFVKSMGLDSSMLDTGDVDMPTIQAIARGLGIFGENDALVMTVKTDDALLAKEIENSVHIDFNIVELAEALGEDAGMMYPLTKENSDIDITFKSKTVYNKVNEENIVELPALTEGNSVDVMEAFGLTEPEEEYEVPEFEVYQSEFFWDNAKGMMDRGGMYIDMEGFIDSCYWDDDNLVGEVVLGEDGTIEFALTSDNFGTVTVKGSLFSDEYTVNSTTLWGRKPFKVVEEYNWDEYAGEKKLYVNMDVLDWILGAKVQSIQTYILDDELNELTSPEYYFDVVRPNPAYVAPVEYDVLEDIPEALFSDEAASIGIIGGADGPTEIFITE